MMTTELHFLPVWSERQRRFTTASALETLLLLGSMELLGCLSVLLVQVLVLASDDDWWTPKAPLLSGSGVTEPPTLSLHPQHPIYTQGEDITLTCSAPAGLPLVGYTFYEERGGQVLEVQPKGHNNTFRLDGTTAGTFHCVYQILESGQEIQSPKSGSVSVARTKSPQAPTLSLHPQHPVYIQGEEVALTCSAPKQLTLRGYELYEEIGGQPLKVHVSLSNTFKLNGKTAEDEEHSCAYWALVSGRKIRSQRSNSVFLAWRDPPPPPVLEINPPPRAVYEGEPLLISCLSSSNIAEKRFHFYKDGVEMDSSNEGSLRSSREPGDPSSDAALRIPQFNSSHGGEFACSYEENMNGRWVPSPWSQKVNITVQPRDSLMPVLMYVRLALVLLIPMISLVYYCHQRRKRAFQPQERKGETVFVNHGRFEPQIAALQLQTETRLKRLKAAEEDERYSEMLDQPAHRPKPGEVGRPVLYREIQFQPTYKAA